LGQSQPLLWGGSRGESIFSPHKRNSGSWSVCLFQVDSVREEKYVKVR